MERNTVRQFFKRMYNKKILNKTKTHLNTVHRNAEIVFYVLWLVMNLVYFYFKIEESIIETYVIDNTEV